MTFQDMDDDIVSEFSESESDTVSRPSTRASELVPRGSSTQQLSEAEHTSRLDEVEHEGVLVDGMDDDDELNQILGEYEKRSGHIPTFTRVCVCVCVCSSTPASPLLIP
jgi:hypothetical protein